VSLAKKLSTALSQDADVGVKWKAQRRCRTSYSRTLECLWVGGRHGSLWNLRLDGVEEADELLMAMPTSSS
jgi:hypothetical protein